MAFGLTFSSFSHVGRSMPLHSVQSVAGRGVARPHPQRELVDDDRIRQVFPLHPCRFMCSTISHCGVSNSVAKALA